MRLEDGMELWEIEEAFFIDRGTKSDRARAFVIIHWALLGDLRPLAWAIRKDHAIDKAVLAFLVKLIEDERLRVVPSKRGSPKKPETLARDLLAAFAYEHQASAGGSEAIFEKIASVLCISDKSIRQAVTRWRKHRTTNPDLANWFEETLKSFQQ
jgi:hypothetical protein